MTTGTLRSLMAFALGSGVGSMNAQSFVDTANTWSTVICVNFGGCSTVYYRFVGDTIIDGTAYQKLYSSADVGMSNSMYEGAFREDSVQAVFSVDDVGEFLCHSCNVEVGDTILVGPSCAAWQRVVSAVDSITLLTGEQRRRVQLQGVTEEWIEGIGGTLGPMGHTIAFCASDLFPRLNCFSKSDTLLYDDTTFPGCDVNTIGLSEVAPGATLIVSPNPFNTSVVIQCKDASWVETVDIVDPFGRLVQRHYGDLEGGLRMDLRDLASGRYTVHVIGRGSAPIRAALLKY